MSYPPTATTTTTVAEILLASGAVVVSRADSKNDSRAGRSSEATSPDSPCDGDDVAVIGRVMLRRNHGGIIFFVIQQDGQRIQVVAQRDSDPASFSATRRIERGDIISVAGTLGRTRSGELSIFADQMQVLTPTRLPPPDKHQGPQDPGRRARERELDLISNPSSRERFALRSAVIHALRSELHDLGFTEVETPVFSSAAGGAVARPFVTHHNALGTDLFMRIAPELYLKRLVVGGFDRVFEIGRVFRNEGIDATHNPEFTILEAYEAPGDYLAMMDLVERLVRSAARAAGSTSVRVGGHSVDLMLPWRRVAMVDLVEEVTGHRIDPAGEVEDARRALEALGLVWKSMWGPGRCLVEAFEECVEATLIEPTIVMNHPIETSPLARRHRSESGVTERFELYIDGREVANAYSELNDPDDQRSRMDAAAHAHLGEEGEISTVDEDFLRALDRGLPPTGGLGVGVDRLVMLLSGATTIRDVILFPTMRPENRDATSERVSQVIPTAPLPTTVRPGAPVAVVRLSGLVRVVATLTTVVGVLTMLSAMPGLAVRVAPIDSLFSPVPRVADEKLMAVGLGLVMVLLSGQLLRGKRRAWKLAVALFSISAALSLVRGVELVALITSLVMLVVLLVTRSEFTGLRDPPSLSQVLRTAPRYLFFVYAYGLLAIWSQRNSLQPDFGWFRSIGAVTMGLFGETRIYTYSGRFAVWFPDSMLLLGIVGLLLLLWLLLRPAVAAVSGDSEGRGRAEALVGEWGWDTLAPFALRADRSWFFSSDGKAMIAYGYLGGFALGAGDPIGAPESIPLVVDEFIAHCRHHGWQPAFLAVREIDVAFYAERGFRDLYLGDEAILDCRKFRLDRPGMAPVRQAVNRLSTSHRFELLAESDAGPELVAKLNEISLRWRRGEDERGYTMAMSQDVSGQASDRLLAIAYAIADEDEDDSRDAAGPGGPRPGGVSPAAGTSQGGVTLGEPVAFLRILPTGCPNSEFGRAYTLDLMRRLPESANGIIEFLVSRCAAELDERGVRRLSLNFAAFSRLLDEDFPHTRVERLLGRIVDAFNPYFQIRSLRDFNGKFQPEWQPRSLIYADPADLFKVGLRYAFLEGFVDSPVLGRLLAGPTRSFVGVKDVRAHSRRSG